MNFKTIILAGILFRLCFFFTEPKLSDDVYRFVWDGELIAQGINPYMEIPSDAEAFAAENQDLYEALNSKNYFSVYPPMMQSVFYMASFFSDALFAKITFFRCILLLAEIAVMLLLARILSALKLSKNGMAIYALNPLIIIETIGNLHFEGLMICFFLFGFYQLILKGNDSWSTYVIAALFFAFGIMTKLTLALILPVLLFFQPFKKLVKLAALTLCFCVFICMPFFSYELLVNFSQSLDLYFRSFEFNASFFYLVNYIGTQIKGWDTVQIIGPMLSLISLALIAFFCLFRKKQNWLHYFSLGQMAFFIYLAFSTTVHPWYVINLVVLSVFTKKLYPLLWSCLVYLSYYMYSNDLHEPTGLLILEYAFVFVVFFCETFLPLKTNSILERVPLFQEDDNLG